MDFMNQWKGLENALDAASLRQQVISNNIANAGTPNFKSQAVAFEDEMKKAIASKSDSGVSLASFGDEEEIEEDDFGIAGKAKSANEWQLIQPKVYGTGQSIDVNKEMVDLAKNQIHYGMLADKLGGMMNSVIKTIDEAGGR